MQIDKPNNQVDDKEFDDNIQPPKSTEAIKGSSSSSSSITSNERPSNLMTDIDNISTSSDQRHLQIELNNISTTSATNKTQIQPDGVQLHSNQGTTTKTTGNREDDDTTSGPNMKQRMAMDMIMSQGSDEGDDDDDHQHDNSTQKLMAPLVLSSPRVRSGSPLFRSRKKNDDDNYDDDNNNNSNHNNNHNDDNNNNNNNDSNTGNSNIHHLSNNNNSFIAAATPNKKCASQIMSRKKEQLRNCCDHVSELQRDFLRNTFIFMNFMARILFWVSLVALTIGVGYYSRELYYHGTEPHLVAWFSAGAFVILGFPISIYGILMHLANYYQPNVQCYVVRILWMVPIYSIESWLCLRFHEYAIYIETLRDVYESFVLYCFLQFLIEVLGGEEALILMLKDKSPTRGFHYAPMNWCLKPWIMGQPVLERNSETTQTSFAGGEKRTVKWTSPFFMKCKFGCLQYVLLKFVLSICVCFLELYDVYKEGDFTTKGGYLYICILTNLSQCWALYCLVIFYYATKNELSPIRPVGKFLSVKALVFFTWWQSLAITILSQMELIPSYDLDNMSPEAVAKGLQAYLICIEMFIGAIVHMFVFPHTDYLKPIAMSSSSDASLKLPGMTRRLGRHGMRNWKDELSLGSKAKSNENIPVLRHEDVENPHSIQITSSKDISEGNLCASPSSTFTDVNIDDHLALSPQISVEEQQHRTNFASALIDSFVPRDVMDSTVGIARGDFTVEKKTLLYHAAASDQYSLFAKRKAAQVRKNDDGN